MKTEQFVYQIVSAMPDKLQPGILYHSPDHEIISHLCACGCGREVVNGLREGRWTLRVVDGLASLSPSIGNGSFSCKSHYFITDGRVICAGAYTDQMIAFARQRDNPRAHVGPPSFWKSMLDRVLRFFGMRGN